jgi:transposase-like protein
MSVTTTAPRTSVTYPGRRATDLRIAVRIEEPSTPFPIVIYFVYAIDDKIPNAWALIPVGIELGQRFERVDDGQPHKKHPIGEHLPRPLDRAAVQEVVERFREYVEYARGCIAIGGVPTSGSQTPASKPRGKRRRELTDDFLSLIAEQYETWSAGSGRAVTEIANAHGVNRSTSSRWVKAAKDRGFFEPVTEQLGHASPSRPEANRNRRAVTSRAR